MLALPPQAGKIRLLPLSLTLLVSCVSLGGLLVNGHTQMSLFLVFTTALLPLFSAAVHPRAWPSVPLLLAALAAVWRWEGVRPLFLGLYLFQLLPVTFELCARALPAWPRTRKLASRLIWWLGALSVIPLLLVAAAAMFAPVLLFAQEQGGSAPGGAQRVWGLLQGCMGVGRGPEDPWRVLKLPRGATLREVKKRVRELSLAYHPDKVGANNPLAHARFLQIQQAAELLTRKGGAEGAAQQAARRALDASKEAATRCVECTLVVAIWLALSFFAWVSALLFGDPAAAAAAAAAAAQAQASQQVQVGMAVPGGSLVGRAPPVSVGSLSRRPLPRVQPAVEDAPAAVQPAQQPAAAARGGVLGWVLGQKKSSEERALTGKERRLARRAAAEASQNNKEA